MIYAMHQSQVACIVDHGGDVAWQRDLLARIVERAMAARVGDVRRDDRRQHAHERLRGRSRRRRVQHREARADDFVWRARRLHSRHRAPSSGCAAVGSGADRRAARHVHARTARHVGHARHARHLQRRPSARRAAVSPSRSCRRRSRRSPTKACCRSRTRCGHRYGSASPATP